MAHRNILTGMLQVTEIIDVAEIGASAMKRF